MLSYLRRLLNMVLGRPVNVVINDDKKFEPLKPIPNPDAKKEEEESK